MKNFQRTRCMLFLLVVLFITLFSLTLLEGTAKAAEAQKIYKFKMQNIYVPGTQPYIYTGPKFKELVNKMSGGRIQIEVFGPGALAPPDQILQALGKGMFEISASAGAYVAGVMPEAYIEFGMPGGVRNYEELMIYYDNLGFADTIRKAYAKHNVYYLGSIFDQWYGMISKKPIRTVKDFKGLKVRSTGIVSRMFAELGASPVFLPLSECYTGLAMGTIDAVSFCGPDSHWDMKLMEVAKYEIAPPIMTSTGNIIINMDIWKALPEDLKTILEVATKEIGFQYYTTAKLRQAEVYKKMKEQYKVELITFSGEELKKWNAAKRKIWDFVASKSPEAKKSIKLLQDWVAECESSEW